MFATRRTAQLGEEAQNIMLCQSRVCSTRRPGDASSYFFISLKNTDPSSSTNTENVNGVTCAYKCAPTSEPKLRGPSEVLQAISEVKVGKTSGPTCIPTRSQYINQCATTSTERRKSHGAQTEIGKVPQAAFFP
jgi:hypothetical protein